MKISIAILLVVVMFGIIILVALTIDDQKIVGATVILSATGITYIMNRLNDPDDED